MTRDVTISTSEVHVARVRSDMMPSANDRFHHAKLRSDRHHSSSRTSMSGAYEVALNEIGVDGRLVNCPKSTSPRRFGLSPQPIDATQALNLSAGVSNCNVFLGRSFS
jgi:hypothetical protein